MSCVIELVTVNASTTATALQTIEIRKIEILLLVCAPEAYCRRPQIDAWVAIVSKQYNKYDPAALSTTHNAFHRGLHCEQRLSATPARSAEDNTARDKAQHHTIIYYILFLCWCIKFGREKLTLQIIAPRNPLPHSTINMYLYYHRCDRCQIRSVRDESLLVMHNNTIILT